MIKPSQLEENWGKDLEKRGVFSTCNMCHKQMDEALKKHPELLQEIRLWTCLNARCPNFALYQIPAEDLPTPKKKKKVVK